MVKVVCGDVYVEIIILFDGEQYKNLVQFEVVMICFFEFNVVRDIMLIVLGGGVIGDFIGFVVVIY